MLAQIFTLGDRHAAAEMQSSKANGISSPQPVLLVASKAAAAAKAIWNESLERKGEKSSSYILTGHPSFSSFSPPRWGKGVWEDSKKWSVFRTCFPNFIFSK